VTIVLGFIYTLAAVLLAIYALNAWVLTGLYLRHRHDLTPPPPAIPTDSLPPVTIQLPVYNEALVVERLIAAAASLEYPAHLLQIQVLDDSTDETTSLAQVRAAWYRQRGLDVEVIHRNRRPGFKAGALGEATKRARGELIAIFDADFVPAPDFLRQTVPYFIDNLQLGFVQARWGHLNPDYSRLTGAQAIALDGHFGIEQTARHRAGLLMNFNGSGGLWRRACVEQAGGWQTDTISEDLDLSYRAQLAGWQALFLRDVVAPAEIPPQLAAFKRQQFRWAKGSIQCLKKMAGPVLRSTLAWRVKVQAMLHLSSYLIHPLMILLLLGSLPLLLDSAQAAFSLTYLSAVSLGPPLLYAVALHSLYGRGWHRRYRYLLLLILLGGGVALSNTRAVVEGWLGVDNTFQRTPKFRVENRNDRWQESAYRLPLQWIVLGELGLAFYGLAALWAALANRHFFAAPFMLMYALGFGYVGLQGMWDGRGDLGRLWSRRARRPSGAESPGSRPAVAPRGSS
jgi:cellulose synthase/poly-beta-1,6-N-acetylglucosamine synthase-like glycosyltransferase